MKKIGIVLMAIIAFSSCTQDDTSTTIEEQNTIANLSLGKASGENPLEYVGELHNIALAQAIEASSYSHESIIPIVSELMNEDVSHFAGLETLEVNMDLIVRDGYDYYKNIWVPGLIEENEKAYLNEIEVILLADVANDRFINRMDQVVTQILNDEQLHDQSKEILLGITALAKHSYLFWADYDRTSRARKHGKFWADVGGFASGVVGTLIYNNNNGDGFDFNPIGNGVTVGTAASALAGKDDD